MSSGAPLDSGPEVYVGTHMFRWEPPDTCYIRYNGNLDGPTMGAMAEQSRMYTVGKPVVFLLVDMARAGKISAEARQRSAQGGKELNLRGIAVIGASAPLRLIAGLVSRAVDLINRNTDNPTRFFESESEARAWIAARRQALHQAQGVSP